MKHALTVKCRRRNGASGSSGYSVGIHPPIVRLVEGEDIEGFGWWPYNPPRRVTVAWVGWFRRRETAADFARVHGPGIVAGCRCTACARTPAALPRPA